MDCDVVPDGNVYRFLLSARTRCDQPDRALEVFQTMRLQGILPDVINYNCLISDLAKQSKTQQAMQGWLEMQCEGVIPDVETYNIATENHFVMTTEGQLPTASSE